MSSILRSVSKSMTVSAVIASMKGGMSSRYVVNWCGYVVNGDWDVMNGGWDVVNWCWDMGCGVYWHMMHGMMHGWRMMNNSRLSESMMTSPSRVAMIIPTMTIPLSTILFMSTPSTIVMISRGILLNRDQLTGSLPECRFSIDRLIVMSGSPVTGVTSKISGSVALYTRSISAISGSMSPDT